MPSSVIGHIAYRESRSELTITFVSGKTYAYGLVPKRIYEDFRRSSAKGNFFNAHIRDRYPARRMKSDPTHELAARGYAIARRVIDSFLIIRLIEVLEGSEHRRSERDGETYGMRDLLALEEIRQLAQSSAIMSLIIPSLALRGARFAAYSLTRRRRRIGRCNGIRICPSR